MKERDVDETLQKAIEAAKLPQQEASEPEPSDTDAGDGGDDMGTAGAEPDSAVGQFEDDPSASEEEDDSVSPYKVQVANHSALMGIYRLLKQAHEETPGLPPVDVPLTLHTLVELIKIGVVYVLSIDAGGGKGRVVGVFAWGVTPFWFADQALYKDFFDLAWYVAPDHRSPASLDLIKFAIPDARARFAPFRIRIDTVNATVDRDALDKVLRQLGGTPCGSIYRF